MCDQCRPSQTGTGRFNQDRTAVEESLKLILMKAAQTAIASGGFTIRNVPLPPVPPRPDRRFWLVPPHTGITRDMLPEGPKC